MAYILPEIYLGHIAYEHTFCGIIDVMDIALIFLITLTFINTVVLLVLICVTSVFIAWFFVRFNRSLIETACLLAEVADMVKMSKLTLEKIEWRS